MRHLDQAKRNIVTCWRGEEEKAKENLKEFDREGQ